MKSRIVSTTDPMKAPKTDYRALLVNTSHYSAKQAKINSGVRYLEMDMEIQKEKARKYPSQSYIDSCERVKKNMEHFYLENQEAVIVAFNAKYGINAR